MQQAIRRLNSSEILTTLSENVPAVQIDFIAAKMNVFIGEYCRDFFEEPLEEIEHLRLEGIHGAEQSIRNAVTETFRQ